MRTFLSLFMITLLTFGLFSTEAQAKRFGGGRSFGVQRPMSSFSSPMNKQASNFGKANTNRWGGMLGGLFGGLLIGGLLSSLFMGNGLLNGLLTWLVLGAIVLFIINFFRRKMHPSMQGNANQNSANAFDAFKQNFSEKPEQFRVHNNPNYAPNGQQGFKGFMSSLNKDQDAEDFLREAKVKFIRLQTAYDQANLEDIREFTTPEVLAEIQMQFHEQEGASNSTEVVSLEAELLSMESEASFDTAAVRFTGFIKENSDKAEALNEIWHFQRSQRDGKWLVSGVQQIKPL